MLTLSFNQPINHLIDQSINQTNKQRKLFDSSGQTQIRQETGNLQTNQSTNNERKEADKSR